jgi:uncharacterized membrane protein AbrB (regulator of aidB expression)
MIKKYWKIWCCTMGSRISHSNFESDAAAIIRTFWWFMHIITCCFIIANTIRHWNS